MLVIRLARTGRNKYPTYRIVAAEHSRAATGKFVAVLGHYNPHTKELVMKKDEIVRHIGNGAQPSNTVAKLLQREKVKLPDWVQIKTKTSKPKNEKPEEAPKAEEAPEAPAAEAPAEEAAPETPAAEAEAPAAEAETPAEPEAPAEAPADEAAQA